MELSNYGLEIYFEYPLGNVDYISIHLFQIHVQCTPAYRDTFPEFGSIPHKCLPRTGRISLTGTPNSP